MSDCPLDGSNHDRIIRTMASHERKARSFWRHRGWIDDVIFAAIELVLCALIAILGGYGAVCAGLLVMIMFAVAFFAVRRHNRSNIADLRSQNRGVR